MSPTGSLPKPSGRGIFLDRDGVINVYRPEYVRVRADFEYYPFTRAAFQLLGTLGVPICVVSNQSGIARGYTSRAEVDAIHEQLRADATSWGASIAAIEICPHLPGEGCGCRKPGAALFERAAAVAGVGFSGSFMVGDAPSDIEVGRRLGMTTFRVRTGRGAEPAVPGFEADADVEDLLAAARRIAQRLGPGP
ncbi:MAG: D-glycero-alpha-D-manno-heptose-1,7-bisphosphate 7-phosphatase [Planctomycetota bacterium]